MENKLENICQQLKQLNKNFAALILLLQQGQAKLKITATGFEEDVYNPGIGSTGIIEPSEK